MTSSTNPRDFSAEADRLLSGECGKHRRGCDRCGHEEPVRPKRHCRSCIMDALSAAYEAGRADALGALVTAMSMPVREDPAAPTDWRCPRCGYVGWSLRPGHFQRCTEKFCAQSDNRTPVADEPCYCAPDGLTSDSICDCCEARPGEPCRHEVKP